MLAATQTHRHKIHVIYSYILT